MHDAALLRVSRERILQHRITATEDAAMRLEATKNLHRVLKLLLALGNEPYIE